MSSKNVNDTNPDLRAAEAEQMRKYGITCVPVNFFHYREFRYANLTDAIAQAKRDQHHSIVSTCEEHPSGI